MTMASRSRLRFGGTVAACALTMLSLASAARAVPGQTTPAFEAWAHGKPALRGLEARKDELSGLPAYDLTMSDHGIAWHYYALAQNGSIRSELLTVGSDGTASNDPIRHDGRGYGFVFWKALYGPNVAADFRSATVAFSSPASAHQAATTYYRGRRFGYVAAGGLIVETLAVFAADVAQAKKCAAHPADCPGD